MSKLKTMRMDAVQAARELVHAYSAEGLADVAGVSKPTYLKYEEHPEKFSLEQAKRLAEHFECSIEDIFFDANSN